jgi:mevalonate-3-kinase
MVMDSCTAVAYPGLPVVFAEGFRDYEHRVSMHSHASLALTGRMEGVYSETTVRKADSSSFTLNGEVVSGSRATGVLELAAELMALAGVDYGVEVASVNKGIYSGSSDSGAAALAVALNSLLELGLSREELCVHARRVSETAYRSVYGGLSEYIIEGRGNVCTGLLADESFFNGVRVFACPFDLERYSADELHLKVVTHPDYVSRTGQADGRITELKKFIKEGDVDGLLRLMESDAKAVHRLFEGVGLTVVKPEMRRLCELVEGLRSRGVKAYWNVAGGSVVYVFALKKYSDEVVDVLSKSGIVYTEFKVAGPARVI